MPRWATSSYGRASRADCRVVSRCTRRDCCVVEERPRNRQDEHGFANAAVVRAGEAPAVFRVEVRLPGAPGEPPVPWIVSNPIYLRHEPRVRPAQEPSTEVVRTLTDGQGSRAWTMERHPASEAKLQPGTSPGGEMAEHFTWRLAGGAAVRPVRGPRAPGVRGGLRRLRTRLRVTLQAPRPMRISIQVRVPDGGGLRWQRSVYVDATPRAWRCRSRRCTPSKAAATRDSSFARQHAVAGGRHHKRRTGSGGGVLGRPGLCASADA